MARTNSQTSMSLNNKEYQFQNPLSLTKILIVLLYIGIAIASLNVLDSILSYNFYSSAQYASEQDWANNDMRTGVIGIIEVLCSILTIIFFLVWINRVNKNSHALGAQNMQFTSGWSVGWWFIPIAHLWKPYQVVREIWKTSQNSDDWENQENSIVSQWWACWIISIIGGRMIYRWSINVWNSYNATFSDYQLVELAYIFISLWHIFLSIIFIKMIKQICDGQVALTSIEEQSV